MAQTRVPDVSVSQVARRYDVNANLVFKWLRDPRFGRAQEAGTGFLPVEVVPQPGPPRDVHGTDADFTALAGRIEIELGDSRRLILSGAFDPDLVVRLVRGLSS